MLYGFLVSLCKYDEKCRFTVERQNSLAFLAAARLGLTVLPFSRVVGFDLLTFYLEFPHLCS